MYRIFSTLKWCWRQFRRLPLALQVLFGSTSLGAILMSCFIGNMGLAAMGGAVAISGVAAGAMLGALAVLLPWAGSIVIRDKFKR
jgi:hypothetical protein